MKCLNIIIVFAILASIGCKKFVEIDPPKTKTATIKVFNNAANATGALTGIYAQMIITNANHQWSYYMPLYSGLYGDELTSYATTLSIKQIFTNSLLASGSITNDLWSDGYNLIYQANALIEGLAVSTSINEKIRQQIIAEAKFIRAYWHFYLTNFYGDIPIITSTDYTLNATMSRKSQTDVYKQIIADLKDAEENLNPGYVDGSDTIITTDRFRPNRSVASALLARAYLYTARYDSAVMEATKVIDKRDIYDTVPLNSVFLINNKEAIWQLSSLGSVLNNSSEGENFILTGAPLTNNFNCSTISTQLMTAFEAGDQRKTEWIGKSTDNTVTPAKDYYFPYKYKQKGVTTSPQEYSVVLRLAEQYLIRAEARAQLGDIPGAQEDLDRIRHRAGLPNTTASTKDALLTAILHERQVELFCEYGHRWLDLKRTGKVNEVMQVVTPLKGGTWNSTKALWPIPQTEITNDPNLQPQNPGYEGN